MLEEVLRSLNNWFEAKRENGVFEIAGGSIGLPEGWLLDGQYFRIEGSVFNDGLHQWPAVDLRDETFTGRVTALAIDPELIELSNRIDTWRAKYSEAAESPFASQAFESLSYTLKSGADSWRSAFHSELKHWKKL